MKKYFKFFLSFFVPVLIFCICLLINNIAPFGKYIISIYDAKMQYPAFFTSLKDFHFYSFNLGMGFNLLGTATYYLMSPLNLIIKFFDIYHYNTFYFLLVVLKIGLCGLTMQVLLNKEKRNPLWSTIFSVIYALIGYNVSYYYNIFWLDGIILLPLVMIGINKIVNNESPLFYIITLSISIIISYYTGYMSCIFSVIYFIYKLVETEKYKNYKIIRDFIISSILVGIISCIILIPSFYALINSKAHNYGDNFTNYWQFNKNIMYLFYSFTPGNFHSSIIQDGFAQNYCTLFITVLFFTSFFNKNLSKKSKITTLVIILFYILSYSFNLVDFSWQLFQKPVWWQHRYSFTLSFFMILIAYKNINNFDALDLPIIKRFILLLVFCLLVAGSFFLFFKSLDIKNVFRIIIIIFGLLLIFNYLFLFDVNNNVSKIIIIFFIICELFINSFISIKSNNFKNTLSFDITTKKSAIKIIQKTKKLDSSFYRSELVNPITSNDGLLFNYYGINYFNSVRNKNMINLAENYLGIYTDSHSSIALKKFDPYILSLLDIKYILGDNQIYYYEQIDDSLYQNNNNIALGFMVNKNITEVKLKNKDYFNNISNIYSTMLNKEYNLYHTVDNKNITLENAHYDKEKMVYTKDDATQDASISVEFIVPKDSLLLIDYSTLATKVFINDEEIIQNKSYIYMRENDKVHIDHPFIQKSENLSISSFHYIDIKELETITQQLSKSTLSNIQINKKHLFKANINVEDSKKLLYTSIIYEKGMIIKVNGKKIDPNILLDCFVGLKLNKGKNIITIDYIPKGLINGLIISIIGMLLTYTYIRKKK